MRWGILLPQGEVDDVVASAEYYVTTPAFTVPQHGENDYLDEGIALNLVESYPIGAINGKFTINSSGGQVYFSKGNLQYQASTNTWRFAEHQNAFVGDATYGNVYEGGEKCDNALISSTYSGWIDLFIWGTSGYNHGAVYYQPWSTNTDNAKYYAYGVKTNHLYSSTGQADWGYNAISNGGEEENSGWRTLTINEWSYVLDSRVTASGMRWARGTVNGVNGYILFPDDWSPSIYAITDPDGGNYESNTINADDWANFFQANGAVFLPAAGSRSGNVGTHGYYWSSSNGDNGNGAQSYLLRSNVKQTYYVYRGNGFSVRLARNVQ